MTSLPFSQKLAQQYFESTEQFPVDFDDAWQWLDYSRKDNAKANFFKCGFVEGVDYVSAFLDRQGCLTDKRSDQNGKFLEVIKLTCECFKQWGMMTGTVKGKEIRIYFLECERIAKQVARAKSPLELLQEAVEIAIAHEQRIKALEQHNDKMRQDIEEVKEAQEVQELEIVANSAELERFKNGHGDWYTVVGYATKHNKGSYSCRQANLLGRKASALCRLNNITPEKINDPRFGKVNAYPEWILAEVM